MFGIKENKERIRLLEYENEILTHRLNDLLDQLDDLLPLRVEMPMPPFSRVYSSHKRLPSYEEFNFKYRGTNTPRMRNKPEPPPTRTVKGASERFYANQPIVDNTTTPPKKKEKPSSLSKEIVDDLLWLSNKLNESTK